MGKKEAGKPRGRMSAYAFFVQTCREEHKKKHPSEGVQFAEFSKKCSDRWKLMGPPEKKRFDQMSEKDKTRYEREMAAWTPTEEGAGKRKKQKKDPNAPKRALSAFFHYCAEERPKVREANPSYSVGDVAKELGARWAKVTDKTKYDALAAADKQRYEAEMATYRGGGGAKKQKVAPVKAVKPPAEVEESDEEEDDDEEEDSD